MRSPQWVGSIDLAENPEADANILVNRDADFVDQETQVVETIKGLLNDDKIEAVVCVAVSSSYHILLLKYHLLYSVTKKIK